MLREPLNFNTLIELYKKEIISALDSCPGPKSIIWDDDLTGPLDTIADARLFKEKETLEMLTLGSDRPLSQNSVQVIFLIRGNVKLMRQVAKIVHRDESSRGCRKDFNIFFIPKKTLLCERKLKDLGVYGTFKQLNSLDILLFPLDRDVISTEMPHCFKDCHIENDCGSLYDIARALLKLESIYGTFRRICGKGVCSYQVWKLLQKLHVESGSLPDDTESSQMPTLLLIDRQTDLVSPLVTPLTYEGLIDYCYGIKHNKVRLPADKFSPKDGADTSGAAMIDENEPKVLPLSSHEELYAEIRDKNFNAIGGHLSKKAREISAQFEARHEMKTVAEVKKFVARLPQLQAVKASLATHTCIAELIKETTDSEDFLESLHLEQEILNCNDTDKPNVYIEDCIAKEDPFIKVLRLMCLQSVVNGGFKQKVLEYYQREILHTYGFQHILTLQNLQKAGIMMLQGRTWYASIRRLWNLTVTEVSETEPQEPAYVHSGYCPLSIRLCQFAAKKGMDSLNDVLTQLPGQTFDDYPYGIANNEDNQITLVFFVGGVTFAEIAALRFLSQKENAPMEYIVGTTGLINGKTFVENLKENLIKS